MRIGDMNASAKRRPVFFKLAPIQMPEGALTLITHRVTGHLLAIGARFGIYLLDLSLQSPQSYAQVTSQCDQLPFRAATTWIVFTELPFAFGLLRCWHRPDGNGSTGYADLVDATRR